MNEEDTSKKVPHPGSFTEAIANCTNRKNPEFVAPRVAPRADMQEIEKRLRQQAIDNEPKEGAIAIECVNCNKPILRRVRERPLQHPIRMVDRSHYIPPEISYVCNSCAIPYDKEVIEQKLAALENSDE